MVLINGNKRPALFFLRTRVDPFAVNSGRHIRSAYRHPSRDCQCHFVPKARRKCARIAVRFYTGRSAYRSPEFEIPRTRRDDDDVVVGRRYGQAGRQRGRGPLRSRSSARTRVGAVCTTYAIIRLRNHGGRPRRPR